MCEGWTCKSLILDWLSFWFLLSVELKPDAFMLRACQCCIDV